MRISTSNLASSAGIQEDLKAAFDQSGSVRRAIWGFKSNISGLTQDVYSLSSRTSLRKRDLGRMNIFSRMWQAIQSMVSSFREKLNRLLQYLRTKTRPATSGKAIWQAEEKLGAARQTLPSIKLYSGKGVPKLYVKSSADAELAIQNLIHALPPNLTPAEVLHYLQHFVARGRYNSNQLSWLYQAIERQSASFLEAPPKKLSQKI